MIKKQGCILIGILVILAFVSVSGCIKQTQNQQSQKTLVNSSSRQYDQNKSSPFNSSDLGIKEITWINDTSLQVKAYVNINCAEKIENTDYEIIDGKIVLIYKSPRCKIFCANCFCTHELVYNFTNLEKKDYQFELKRVE